jgi:hypothetical protein
MLTEVKQVFEFQYSNQWVIDTQPLNDTPRLKGAVPVQFQLEILILFSKHLIAILW